MVVPMEQLRTPLFDQLTKHSKADPISLHVPGHKNGHLFPLKGKAYYNELLKLDVTELTGLDDLHSPEGAILESELLLANLYGVEKSFFLVNGTTVGNLAMILGTVEEGDIVLVQRNCHKSILNGLQLANADPIFLSPEYDEDWNAAGGLSYETVLAGIKAYPKAKAIILTYPNYYGMVYELGPIIKLAHDQNIPVLVDEAHGAHFIAGDPFPVTSLKLGADVVVQSAHKTLPAMTMGSFLHFNSRLVSIDLIEKYLYTLQSSSPSYPIMASLDLARSFLGTYDSMDLIYIRKQIIAFRKYLSNITGIKVLDYKRGNGDLLKITIQAAGLMSGFELQKKFEELGVFAELADPFNLLFIVPLLKEGMCFPFDELLNKAAAVMKDVPDKKIEKEAILFQKKDFSKLALDFKSMRKRPVTKVPLNESIGHIAAEMIIPYPPGIPLLFPGEIITADDILALRLLLEKGTRFQGGKMLKEGLIYIY